MASIDYGLGTTNIDHATGIRYGVISQNEVLQAWADSSEAQYGDPHCPKCGNEAITIPSHTESSNPPGAWVSVIVDMPEAYEDFEGSGGYACEDCQYMFDGDEAFGDEPLGFTFSDNEYEASQDSYGDIFITRSPFFTLCEFCSPCAPGAGYIINEGNVRAYCFGHDWFDEGKAPYRVFSVETNEEIIPTNEKEIS